MAIKPLNSVAGFSVGETPTSVILANGDITTTNITTTGVSNLNSIGNVKMSGGSSGQVISTDGAGNLSFVTISTSGLTNGNSNIQVLTDANITFSSAGNANIVVITGTGVNVAGTLNTGSGNANVGNLGTGGQVIASGTVTGGNLSTGGTLNATGNANVGNLGTAQVLATANVTAPQLISNIATGTAPLVISSTTLVSNLNADLLDGYNTAVANTANTVVVRDANGNVSANFFIGDGSQLTGIDTSKISNGNSNVTIPTAAGNVITNVNGSAILTVYSGGIKVGGSGILQSPGGATSITLNNNGANIPTANITTALNVTGATGAAITANVTAGNVYANSGIIGAQTLKGEGGNISNIQGANVSGTVASATTAGTVTTAAQPNITSLGVLSNLIVANTIYADGYGARTGSDLTLSTAGNGNLIISTAGTGITDFSGKPVSNISSLGVTGNVTAGNVYANSGIIGAQTLKGEGGNISNIQGANVSGTVSSATTAGTVTTNAQPNITSVGTLSSLEVTGNTTSGNFIGALANGNSNVNIPSANGNVNITAVGNTTLVVTGTGANITGNVNVSGNVFAPAIVQNASSYDTRVALSSSTGIIEANTNGNATQFLPGGSVRLSAAGSGQIISGTFDGSGITLGGSQVDIYQNRGGNVTVQVGTSGTTNYTWTFAQNGSLTVPNNLISSNVYANSGIIGAQTLKGEGGNISNIQGANVSGTVASATNASAVLNNVSTTGTVYPTFISSTANANYSLTSNTAYSANIANGFFGATLLGGTLTTAAQPNVTSVGTLSSLAVTGNVTGGNVYANSGTIGAQTLTASGNVNAANANISANLTANFITSTNGVSITNGPLTVSAGNLDVTGNINVTGNLNYSNVTDLVVGDPLIYIGANNTGDLYDLGIVASYNDGTYYHTGIARNHTTDTWTFFDGVIAEPTTVIDWANATYPTVKLGNLVATANANIAGYANVVGNITAGNITAGNLLTANYVSGTLTTSAQPNITSVGTLSSLSVTANVVSGNVYANSGIIGAQTLKGEGGNLSNITGANVSGTVANANYAAYAGNVTIAAQSNITSVGTLTGLNVNGNIVAANITANTGVFTGNAAGLTNIPGGNVTGQVANALVAGTVYTAAQPNITSVGTLSSLSVTGNISSGNISATNGNVTTANVSGNIILGNASVTTTITWASTTTTSVTANQTIASFSVTGVTGVEFLVKGIDSTGSKYSVATVQAVTDGANVDYSTYGGVNLGGYTGALAVNVVGGFIRLQVTPASSNSTVWTTQYRLI